MNKFLIVLCLISISSIVIFAQDLDVKPNKQNETLALNKKPVEIDKVKFNIIKDDQSDLNKITIEEPKPFTKRQSSGGDEYNKNEFYIGYSYQNIDRRRRDNFNGFNASYVRNVSRYLGVKADVSGAFRNDSFTFNSIPGPNAGFTITSEINSSLYNFLGGVQFKDNASDKRLKPFAHALAGAALLRISSSSNCTGNCPTTSGSQSFSDSAVRFSSAFGGGLDIKINDKIDFRAIQFDYNPIFTGGGVDSNFRVGVGIVFK